jgi:hypothetical protein
LFNSLISSLHTIPHSSPSLISMQFYSSFICILLLSTAHLYYTSPHLSELPYFPHSSASHFIPDLSTTFFVSLRFSALYIITSLHPTSHSSRQPLPPSFLGIPVHLCVSLILHPSSVCIPRLAVHLIPLGS